MKVNAIQCPGCKDIIYSRATHDFRSCSCGATYIDGGFNYIRIGYKMINKKVPKHITLDIAVSRKELHDDWNYQKNKFGLIKETK